MHPERIHVYQIGEPLATSGVGQAFRATVAEAGGPLEPGRLVLLRIIETHDAGGEVGVDRVLAAHAAARNVMSKAVLAPVDHGVLRSPSGRRFWSVTPWSEARTLASILATVDVVPDPLTECLANGIMAAVCELHQAGVIGLGLGPDSVLMGSDASVILTDTAFGAAVPKSWPASGKPPASMMCAAPEAISQSDSVGSRTDLFAVGALMYRCMTGRWHRPEDANALRAQSAEMPAARPNDERLTASLFLSEVAFALLHPDIEQRPSSAADLSRILKERRHGAWWKSLHIAQDTHGAEAARQPIQSAPALPPIPEPTLPPDADWFASRRERESSIGECAIACVGREEESATILGMISPLARELGGVLLLEGVSGVGKTRLLDSVCDRARALPGNEAPLILYGSHRRVGVGRPFGALTEAITRFLNGDRSASTEDVAMLLGDASGIATPFAALLSSETPPSDGPRLRRETIIEGFQRCLRTLCTHAPVVLIVENLQWADRESLEAFDRIARMSVTVRLLVIGTHHPVVPGSGFDEYLGAITQDANARALMLGGLDTASVASMCKAIISPESAAEQIAARLSAGTEGLPGHIIETLRALEDEGHFNRGRSGLLTALPQLATAELPASSSEIAPRRFAGLSVAGLRYAFAAAIQGMAFDTEVARIACGLDPADGAQVVAILERRGIVSTGGIARRFASNLLFDYAHDAADPQTQRDLHESTATAFLESRNPLQLPPSQVHGVLSFRVAWHYLLAGRSSRGLLYVMSAVAHLRATWRLSEADRLTALACGVLANDSNRPADLIDMLLERARVLEIAGHLDDQRSSLDEALARSRDLHDVSREARVLEESVRNYIACGQDALASAEIADAVAAAETVGDQTLELRLNILAAKIATKDGRIADARAMLSRAVETAQVRGDDEQSASALQALGTVLQSTGQFDEAERAFESSLALVRAAGDMAREAEILACVGNVAAVAGDLVRAEGHLRRALAIHAALGDGLGETRVLGNLAMVLQESGFLLEARDAHRTCVERTARIGARGNEIVARLNLATSEYFLGRIYTARDEYGDALRSARALGDERLQGYALTGLGDVARQTGNMEVARDLFRRAVLQFRRTRDPSGLAAGLLAAARAEAFAGDNSRARSAASEALRLASQQNARQVAAVAGALLALLDARSGNADAAGRRIGEANIALDDERASSATHVELLFIHSLVLRVLRRPTEAGRKLLQAQAAVEESLRALPDAERAAVVANLSPYREIEVGAAALMASPEGSKVTLNDTVAIG